MKKILALFLVLLIITLIAIPFVAIAAGATTTDPYMPVMAVQATPDPVVILNDSDTQEADPGGIDFTPLLQALIGVLALVITRYVVPWLEARTKADQLARIDYWYHVAVTAAEKAYGAGHGAEKLADATTYLKSKGIIIDDKIVDALIKELFDDAKQTA